MAFFVFCSQAVPSYSKVRKKMKFRIFLNSLQLIEKYFSTQNGIVTDNAVLLIIYDILYFIADMIFPWGDMKKSAYTVFQNLSFRDQAEAR